MITRFLRPIALLIFAVLLAAFAIFFASNYFMHEGFETFFQKNLQTLRHMVDDIVKHRQMKFYHNVLLLSKTMDVEQAFLGKNQKVLNAVAKQAMKECGASFVTMLDVNSVVLARGHSDMRGDNLENTCSRETLAGRSCLDFLILPDIGLSLVATAPVLDGNKVIGAIFLGEAFQNNSLVDEVKDVTGLEMTVFQGDTRISTTIQQNGKRALGTTLDFQPVREDVLLRGKMYSHDVNIFKQAYKTVYWPLFDSNRAILGMWFIGTKIEGYDKAVTSIAVSCLISALAIALALSFFGILFFRAVINPLEKKAYLDALTGISNRAGFEKRFEAAIAKDCKAGALFLVDLDNFKKLNDTLGHPVGDECLKIVAGVLNHLFRHSDMVARLGGDEFIIFAPTMKDLPIVHTKTKTIMEQITREFVSKDGKKVTIFASIGISLFPQHGDCYKVLYKKADLALYETKERGRNGYTVFGESYIPNQSSNQSSK